MDRRLFHFLKTRSIFTIGGNHRIRHYSDYKEKKAEYELITKQKRGRITKKAKYHG